MKTQRQVDKLRPYRIDYFDIDEMKENDLALVRSVVVRAVTAKEAVYQVLIKLSRVQPPISLVAVRTYRYYKNLVHKKDVYKAVEDLFTANKAIKVMEQVEAYRKAKIDESFKLMATDVEYQKTSAELYQKLNPTSGSKVDTWHVARLPDSSPYDEVCVNCGATDTNGKLNQPCPSAPASTSTSGPDSPATKAVVADLQGMLAHDAHEQAMDSFVPNSVPEGKRFPDPANTLPVAEQCTCEETDGQQCPIPLHQPAGEPLIEPDQAVERSARPQFKVSDHKIATLPLWAKILFSSGVLTLAILVIRMAIALLHLYGH